MYYLIDLLYYLVYQRFLCKCSVESKFEIHMLEVLVYKFFSIFYNSPYIALFSKFWSTVIPTGVDTL